MNSATFTINHQTFTIPLNPLESNQGFRIKSVPKPYSVIYDDNPDPVGTINQILVDYPNSLVFIDSKVHELYGSTLVHSEQRILKADATEDLKSIDGMLQLVDFLNRNQATKGEQLLVIGGGIIQDVAAFACAVYKRGIPWTHFPTTLLSQSDSCIGGKAGLNYHGAKNQLALFSAPQKVIINSRFLNTLEPKDIQSGLGEIFKLAITGGRKFLEQYMNYVPRNRVPLPHDAAKTLTLSALSVKKAIIEEDEFELDLRRSMNYGHTFGHAIEILSDYQIPHGQAVTIGILLANELSFKRGFLPLHERNELKALALEILDPAFIEIMKTLPTDGLFQLLKKDKKTVREQVNFVIIHRIGNMQVLPIHLDESLVRDVSDIINELFQNRIELNSFAGQQIERNHYDKHSK